MQSTTIELPDFFELCTYSWCPILIKHGIPSLAVLLSLLISIAPLPSVLRMNRPGGPLVGNPLPFPSLHNLALSWCLYAFLIKDVYLFLSNVLGLVISQFYLASAFTASFPARVHRSMLIMWLFGTLFIIGGFGAAFYFAPYADEAEEPMPPMLFEAQHTSRTARTIAGIVCDTCLVIFYLSPLMMVVDVIKRRRSDSISIGLSTFALINGLLWTGYGMVLRDWWIIAPNLGGVCLALFQVFLACIFPSGHKNDQIVLSSGAVVVPVDEEVVVTTPTMETMPEDAMERRPSMTENDASRPLLFAPRSMAPARTDSGGSIYGSVTDSRPLGRVRVTQHFVPEQLPPRYPYEYDYPRQRHHSSPGEGRHLGPLASIMNNDLGFFGFSRPRQPLPLPQPLFYQTDRSLGQPNGLLPNPYYNTHEGPVVFQLGR